MLAKTMMALSFIPNVFINDDDAKTIRVHCQLKTDAFHHGAREND